MAAELDTRELNKRIAAADREIAAKQEAHEEMLEGFRGEGKTLHDLDPEQMKAVADSKKEIEKLKDDRLSMSDFAQSMAERHAASKPEQGRSLGGSFHGLVVGDIPVAALMAGGIDQRQGVEVASRDQLIDRLASGRSMFRADTASALLDAGIPLDERLEPPVDIRRRQMRLLDLISVGATNTDSVVYARQTTRTSAAAETALGAGYSPAAFDFEQKTATVRSVGHYTTAYRENIADAAQFDTLVRTQLQEDVLLRLESQILSGDGSGSNLEGILDDGTAIPSVEYDSTNERRVMVIHRGITKVRTTDFREPTAVLMHPNDFQEMLFEEIGLSSSEGWAGAFVPDLTGATPGRVWGLPIVVSTVATEGTAVVGYWPDATLWVREGVNLRVTDSHSDFFIKRMVAIVADMRAAFSVQRPNAFCSVLYV